MVGFRNSLCICWLSLACGLAAAKPVTAQQVVRGVVTDDSLRRTIAGAQVQLGEGPAAAVVTDRGGRYSLVFSPGATTITVRAIGYRPVTVALDEIAVDTLTLDFRMIAEAVRLEDVVTTVDAPRSPSARLMEFERRQRMGFGSFLTRAQIARNDALPASGLLRVLRGVRMVPRPHQCGGGYAVATLRTGGSGNSGQPLHCFSNPRATFPQACYMAIYIDGHAVWAYTSPEPPNIDDSPLFLMEAIEVYRGAGEIPPELNTSGASCGAIVMWTRVGD